MKNKKYLLLIKKILKITLFTILGAAALIVVVTTARTWFFTHSGAPMKNYNDTRIVRNIESGKTFESFEYDSYKFESVEPLWTGHYFAKFHSVENDMERAIVFRIDNSNIVTKIPNLLYEGNDIKLARRINDGDYLIRVDNNVPSEYVIYINHFTISMQDGPSYDSKKTSTSKKLTFGYFNQFEQPQDDSGTSEIIHYASPDFNSTYYDLVKDIGGGRFLIKAPDGNFIRFFAKDMEESTIVDMDTLVKITESEYSQAKDTSLDLDSFLEEENEKVIVDEDCFYITLDNGSQKPFCDPEPGVFGTRYDYIGYVPLLNQHLITFSIEEGGHLFVSGVDGEIFRILNSNIRILPKNDSIFIFSSRPDYGDSYEMGGISIQEYSSDVLKKQGGYYGGRSWGVNGFKVSEDGNLYFEIETWFGYPTKEGYFSGDPKSFYFKQPLDI